MSKLPEPFKNKYGFIAVGTEVHFQVENQNMWSGDLKGILGYDIGTKEYVVYTEHSGTLKTNEYLSIYWNTIRPI